MKRILALAILLTATAAWAQYTPPAGAAYIYSGGVWTGAPSTGTLGALSYTPPAIALYCLNGSGQWVPADASCFGGGRLAPDPAVHADWAAHRAHRPHSPAPSRLAQQHQRL